MCVCVSGWLYHTAPQLGDKVDREQRAIQNLSKSVDLDASNGQTWYMLGRSVPVPLLTVGYPESVGGGGGAELSLSVYLSMFFDCREVHVSAFCRVVMLCSHVLSSHCV